MDLLGWQACSSMTCSIHDAVLPITLRSELCRIVRKKSMKDCGLQLA